MVSHLLTLRVFDDVFPEAHNRHKSTIKIKCKKNQQPRTFCINVVSVQQCQSKSVIYESHSPSYLSLALVFWKTLICDETKRTKIEDCLGIYVQWSCINIWSHSGMIATTCTAVTMCIVYISNERRHIIIVCNVYICFI